MEDKKCFVAMFTTRISFSTAKQRYGCLPSQQQIQENREGSPEGCNVIAISKFTFASIYNHLSQQLSALIPHSSRPFCFHVETKVEGVGKWSSPD